MNDVRKEIQPKNIFKVVIQTPLSDKEKDVLACLYQPIIGANSFSLYLTLLSEIGIGNQSKELFHSELIMTLDSSIQQFMQAKKKLEGIGLLDTFIKEDAELGTMYLYQLHVPESVERFFNDEILTLILLDIVGERKFDQLFEKFKPTTFQLTEYQNISSSFKEVYLFNEEQIFMQNDKLVSIEQAFENPVMKRELIDESNDFNWDFYLSQVKKFGMRVPDNEQEFKRLVLLLHEMYGIDEFNMANFSAKAFDYDTNQIVIKELKQVVQKTYFPKKKQQKSVFKKNEQANLTPEEQQTYRYNSLKMNGFSKQDIELITNSEKYPPASFLIATKQADGGYPTNLEKYNINYLIEHSGLPNSVINILINYVYSVEKKPVLEAEHLNKIANDWGRNKVYSPEMAIEYVRNRNKEKKKKQTTYQATYKNKKSIRQETMPDWMINPIPEEKLTPEEQAKIDEKISKFLNKEGE